MKIECTIFSRVIALALLFFAPLCARDCNTSDACCSDSDSSSRNWVVQAEALYWTAKEENLIFASENTTQNDSSIIPEVERNDAVGKNFKSKWTPGFRIGLGYNSPGYCLDSKLRWTHFTNHASDSVVGSLSGTFPGPTETVLYVPSYAFPQPEFDQLRGNWHLQFDTIEFAMGVPLEFENGLIHPYLGMKFDRIEQKLHYRANRTKNFFVGDLLNTTSVRATTQYQGGGILAGADAEAFLGCGFGLYSALSAGLTYGCMSSHIAQATQLISPLDGSVQDEISNSGKYSDQVGRVNVDFAIGLDWKHSFECVSFAIRIGYEYHQYFNQNFFAFGKNAGLASTRGDLVMQGAIFGGDLSF